MKWFSPTQSGLSFGVKTHPSTGSQTSSVHGSLSLHCRTGVDWHWPVAGSHSESVQRSLSGHTTGFAKQPVAESQPSIVHRSLSLQFTGDSLQAAAPATFGLQMTFTQGVLSGQGTTGVLFGVLAPTPGVFASVSWAIPPV